MTTVPDDELTETITLGAATSGITAMNIWFDELARRRGLPPSLAHDIKLCLNEGVANVLFHNLDGRETGAVVVTLRLGPGETIAVIRDNGTAFNPLDMPAFIPADDIASAEIGGLGIKLMLETSERMDYRRDGDENELTLYFPSASAPR